MVAEINPSPEVGSSQGAHRSKAINEASGFDPTASQAKQASANQAREFGGDRSPLSVVRVGGNEVNTAAATRFPPIPEIGKGSITDSIV